MKKGESTSKYTAVYAQIASVLTDPDDVNKIYNVLKGRTISFPYKLYSPEYIRAYIYENYGKQTGGEIARMFGITDRRVRQIAKGKRDKVNE